MGSIMAEMLENDTLSCFGNVWLPKVSLNKETLFGK